MKTKNKILLFTLIIPFIIVVMVILSIQKSFKEQTDSPTLYSEGIDSFTKSFDFTNYENISAEGFWKINIIHGDHFEIELMAPENMLSEITVEKTGQTLVLLSKKNTFSLFSLNKRPRINITLPLISELDIEGVADILISDFNNAKASISMNGVMNVTGENCNFDQFSLSGTGVLNVSMSDVPITNAHFKYNGIYNINILMNGGELTGKLDGMGKIITSGEIAENSIKVNGPGNFKIIQ